MDAVSPSLGPVVVRASAGHLGPALAGGCHQAPVDHRQGAAHPVKDDADPPSRDKLSRELDCMPILIHNNFTEMQNIPLGYLDLQ